MYSAMIFIITTAAFDYLKRHPLEVDVASFEDHCGVGIVVTAEDIENEVRIL